MAAENTGEKRQVAGPPALPWKQRPGESDKAYGVFSYWLRLPRLQRNLRLASEYAGHKHPRVVEGWSSKHEWAARARAFDEHQEDRDDAVAAEARESLLRRIARDRVAYQLAFHQHIGDIPDILNSIAKDEEAPANARVRACLLLIEQAGFTPEKPAETQEGLDELLVAELLRMANVLEPERREQFSDLINEASIIQAAQRAAARADDEAD